MISIGRAISYQQSAISCQLKRKLNANASAAALMILKLASAFIVFMVSLLMLKADD
jgi:hypothetical protein